MCIEPVCLDDHRASPLMIRKRVQVQLCNEIQLRHARHFHEYRANNNSGILLDFSFWKAFHSKFRRRNSLFFPDRNCRRIIGDVIVRCEYHHVSNLFIPNGSGNGRRLINSRINSAGDKKYPQIWNTRRAVLGSIRQRRVKIYFHAFRFGMPRGLYL